MLGATSILWLTFLSGLPVSAMFRSTNSIEDRDMLEVDMREEEEVERMSHLTHYSPLRRPAAPTPLEQFCHREPVGSMDEPAVLPMPGTPHRFLQGHYPAPTPRHPSLLDRSMVPLIMGMPDDGGSLLHHLKAQRSAFGTHASDAHEIPDRLASHPMPSAMLPFCIFPIAEGLDETMQEASLPTHMPHPGSRDKPQIPTSNTFGSPALFSPTFSAPFPPSLEYSTAAPDKTRKRPMDFPAAKRMRFNKFP